MIPDAITALSGALRAELADLTLAGPRARVALAAGVAVGLATLVALALRLDDPWWAGTSALLCTQASAPQSVGKGALRVAGTVAGAMAGLILAPWCAYDPAATLLLLFAAGTLAILGALLSPHGYAWLLSGLTVVIVTLGSLDRPELALAIAVYRAAEVALGVLAALLVAVLLADPGVPGPLAAPGWSSLFGRNWHVLRHATRAGLVVAAVPVVWRVLELPDLGQMAISVVSVMAVPVLTGEPAHDRAVVVTRAAQRLAGCLLGGGAGLLLLALPLADAFLPWLLVLMAGSGLCAQVQSGRHGAGVAGGQAGMALVMTLVQGSAPPASLVPALDRLAGMLGALAMLLAASVLLGPSRVRDPWHPKG